MLEQSLRKLFEQQAEAEPPPGRITIADVLRQGRLRRRRRRIGTICTPALAASAVLAIALTGTLPSGLAGRTGPQAGGYGKLVGGAFNPSYLAIRFGWLPAGYYVTGGATTPGAESLTAYRPRGINLYVSVYTRNACHVAKRRFGCLLKSAPPGSTGQLIARRGPVIDGHRSWWLADLRGQIDLAWEYAPDSWAQASQSSGPSGAASVVRIARALEYGQHIPIMFASRFTSLPRGWRIIELEFLASNDAAGPMPAGVYLASSYSIARLRTISPTTPTGTTPGRPSIGVPSIAVVRENRHYHCNIFPGSNPRHVTIHGVQFTLSDILQTTGNGYIVKGLTGHHVLSFLDLCRGHIDDLSANVYETGVGKHPHLVFPPTKVMERLQLLGTKPANWVTNPLP